MLKQLKYFQSVVRLGSFSAVAEENFISQSAISQQVQSLEHELGFALLVRRNRSFSLTPAGEYCYAAFSARYPDVSVSIAYGSHGELCDMLSEDRVEITLNDQRRLFPTPTKI